MTPTQKVVTAVLLTLTCEKSLEIYINETGTWKFSFNGTGKLVSAVGGISVPVDKFALLAPYIGLAVSIVAVTVGTIYMRKRKHIAEILEK